MCPALGRKRWREVFDARAVKGRFSKGTKDTQNKNAAHQKKSEAHIIHIFIQKNIIPRRVLRVAVTCVRRRARTHAWAHQTPVGAPYKNKNLEKGPRLCGQRLRPPTGASLADETPRETTGLARSLTDTFPSICRMKIFLTDTHMGPFLYPPLLLNHTWIFFCL